MNRGQSQSCLIQTHLHFTFIAASPFLCEERAAPSVNQFLLGAFSQQVMNGSQLAPPQSALVWQG